MFPPGCCHALASALYAKFVTRSDVYALQQPRGGYLKVEMPLTEEKIAAHLRGDLTLGVYQLSSDGKVKWLCFDFDPERLNDPRGAAESLLKVCFERRNINGIERPRLWPHSVLLEASRYPDQSYHLWILFLVPVPAKVARWIGVRLLELSSLDPKLVELFPKQTDLNTYRRFGSLVKLPLGLHRVEHKWSRILDFERFEPLPDEALHEKIGISLSEEDLEKIISFEEKNRVQIRLNFQNGTESKPLSRDEEEAASNFLAKYWTRGRRNRLEMAFLGYCIKRGISLDSARRIIERVCDLTGDEEKAARLRLVVYHYHNRINLGSRLAGRSLIRELIRGAYG